MISEWEEHIKTIDTFIPSIEVALGHRESVSKMEKAVHVRVGKSLKELRLLIGLSYKILVPLPDVTCSWFERDEFVSTCGVFHVDLNK
jgi:hypothetical protein